MNPEHEDRILNACLGEVLGGETPPDLTARILEAWKDRHAAAGEGTPPPASRSDSSTNPPSSPRDVPFAQPVPPPTNGQSSSAAPPATPAEPPQVSLDASSSRSLQRRVRLRKQRMWTALSLSLLLVLAGISLGVIAWTLSNPSPTGPTVARDDAADGRSVREGSDPTSPRVASSRDSGNNTAAETGSGANLARSGDKHDAPQRPDHGTTDPGPGTALVQSNGSSDRPSSGGSQDDVNSSDSVDARPPWRGRSETSPLEDSEIIARANEMIRKQWEEYGVQPTTLATDSEWCRRTYLALLGRIPTVRELTSFLDSNAAEKRQRLVDQLQNDEAYAEEYALNWGTYWTNVLIGRIGGTRQDDLANREGLLTYLRNAIEEDRPFNRMAYELIAATGSNQPGTPEFNGATNFLLSQMDDKAVLATARTSQIFHGKQIQCVQCHNHPSSSNPWTQNQFWELNAFFRQMDVERDRDAGAVRLVDRDFLGEGGGDGQEAEIYYEELNGYARAVYPRFPGSDPISPSGLVSDVNRRAALAKIIATEDDLTHATVNRLWGQIFGFGFTRPVDDMGPHNPPSHPELLELLARQFEANDYSTKKLIRWMALSEPFRLSSKVGSENVADSPEIGSVALFSRYYTRQMEPEAVYDSLLVLAQATDKIRAGKQLDNSVAARTTWLGQFMQDMETDEGKEDTTFDGGIRQSLIMMNGPLMKQATRIEPGSLLHQLLHSKLPLSEKVEHLFLAAVSRHPTQKERRVLQRLLDNPAVGEEQTLQNVWWALLNSNEFILDH